MCMCASGGVSADACRGYKLQISVESEVQAVSPPSPRPTHTTGAEIL